MVRRPPPPRAAPRSRRRTARAKTPSFSQRLGAEVLVHSVSSDSGDRSITFTTSKNGKTLTATHVISSPRLPAPVPYTLTYQRG